MIASVGLVYEADAHADMTNESHTLPADDTINMFGKTETDGVSI